MYISHVAYGSWFLCCKNCPPFKTKAHTHTHTHRVHTHTYTHRAHPHTHTHTAHTHIEHTQHTYRHTQLTHTQHTHTHIHTHRAHAHTYTHTHTHTHMFCVVSPSYTGHPDSPCLGCERLQLSWSGQIIILQRNI